MRAGKVQVEVSRFVTPARHVPTQRQHDLADSIRLYLSEIGRIPLLTADDEVRLARAVEVGVLAMERLFSAADLVDDDKRDLATLIDLGEAAKATLIQSNLRLVVAIAKRYAGVGIGLLDLIQEGNLGLMRAVEKFDYQRGFKFSTYATWWIRQSIARGLADQSRTIRVPVHVVEAMHRAVRAQRNLFQLLGRAPTIEEVSDSLGLSVEKTRQLLDLVPEPVSLDSPIRTGDSALLADLIADHEATVPLDQIGAKLMHSDVVRLLEVVTDREEVVLRLRYGIDDNRPHTLEEVGATLGVTRERARQIEARALGRIRMSQSLDHYRDYLD